MVPDPLMRVVPFVVFLLLAAGCAPQIAKPGSATVEPRLEDRPFAVMQDGKALPVTVWTPDGRPRAAVVALHGFGDYSNAFAALAPALVEAGIAVYAPDQRGFGRGPGYGDWHGHARLARDAETLVRLIKAARPGVPVYFLGESMGGAVAMLALTDRATRADGAVLSAPAVWGRDWMPVAQSVGLDILAHTIPWLPLEPRGLRIRPSDNDEMLRALARDPLFLRRPRVDMVHGLVALMDAAQAAAPDLSRPVLVLYGRRDQLVPRAPTCAMLARLPSAHRVALYANGHHMLFRDLDGARVTADIAAWIGDPAADLPSGEEAGPELLSAYCGVGG